MARKNNDSGLRCRLLGVSVTNKVNIKMVIDGTRSKHDRQAEKRVRDGDRCLHSTEQARSKIEAEDRISGRSVLIDRIRREGEKMRF